MFQIVIYMKYIVPTTVNEEDDAKYMDDTDENKSQHTPCSPVSESEDRFDAMLDEMKREQDTENKKDLPRMSGSLSRSNGTKKQMAELKLSQIGTSNHYETENKILDFIPFHLIPQSQIIEKYQNDFEKIFLKLYDKYIDWKTSSFEINVSGNCRNKLHNIYVRITYQLLMEERDQLILEQEAKNANKKLNIENGWVVNRKDNKNKPRATVMWQSRKTIVNALKATIAKQQMAEKELNENMDDDDKKGLDDNDSPRNDTKSKMGNMDIKVEISEVVEVLTMAEQDIVKNLNDSLRRFKRTHEFRAWLAENMNVFGLA